jgi:hypothetical protein
MNTGDPILRAIAFVFLASRLSATRHTALSGLVPPKPAALTEAATAAPKNEASLKPEFLGKGKRSC